MGQNQVKKGTGHWPVVKQNIDLNEGVMSFNIILIKWDKSLDSVPGFFSLLNVRSCHRN